MLALMCLICSHQTWQACSPSSAAVNRLCLHVTQRKPQRPGTAREGRKPASKRTGIATLNTNDRQPAALTDQAPDSAAKSTHESRRKTPTSEGTLRARHEHYKGPAGSPSCRVLSFNVTRCTSQAGCAALPHRHQLQKQGHAAPPCWGACHQEELDVNHGHTALLAYAYSRSRSRGESEGVGKCARDGCEGEGLSLIHI